MSAVAMMPLPPDDGDSDGGVRNPHRVALKEGVQLATCLGVWAIFLFLVFYFLL
ncbi:hypothetical protein VT84_03455 [Gemmata sp. SH-PL17]|uniref:hypothetical protein n=1 Tax=Gemmata sp. SH-PL17 TaxID=1630693 RepID=UPI00078BD89A|nr:hypothetical protein [Gemmata sp. SH-PL17]AMV23440.1 hypothetical protein VT84_03455 [Gemmata sp. SH-PL17]